MRGYAIQRIATREWARTDGHIKLFVRHELAEFYRTASGGLGDTNNEYVVVQCILRSVE